MFLKVIELIFVALIIIVNLGCASRGLAIGDQVVEWNENYNNKEIIGFVNQNNNEVIFARNKELITQRNLASVENDTHVNSYTLWRGSDIPAKPLLLQVEKIFFKTSSSSIKPKSLITLDKLSQMLKDNPEILLLRVEGHTDSVGSVPSNNKLSEARAWRVYDYLHKKGGIPLERIQYKGFGPSEPIDDNSTVQGRANNRRVDFNVLKITEGTELDIKKLKVQASD